MKYIYEMCIRDRTLTAYNSELSDKPFGTKKELEGGFNTSPLFLNESVRAETCWNEGAILRRAYKLAERACTVWKVPSISDDNLELYKEKDKEEVEYTINDHPYLQNEMSELYSAFKKRVLNLDSSIRLEYKKLYAAFKAQTNFVDAVSYTHLYSFS